MQKATDNKSQLLDTQSGGEEENGHPQQPNESPPPYHEITGQPSAPNLCGFGQSSSGNHPAPISSSQPQPILIYSYTPLQSAAGQPTLHEGVSHKLTGQPIYIVPATASTANSCQPLIISQHETSQVLQPLINNQNEPSLPQLVQTQSTTMTSAQPQPVGTEEPGPKKDSCLTILLFSLKLTLGTATATFFCLLLISILYPV